MHCFSCLSPGPCRLLALCAVVRGLGKGHCDRHPLMEQARAEASLSPAAGTSVPPPASTRAAINNEATRQGQQTQLSHHGMNLATLDKMAPGGGGSDTDVDDKSLAMPSTTKNSASSRAEKWALTSMRAECGNLPKKMRQKPDSAHHLESS